MSDSWYYNFININQAVKEAMVKHGNSSMPDFRYIKDIINTRIGMFTYDNLPKPLTSQILETALMFCNQLCFYYIKEANQWLLCRYVTANAYDYYWKPITVNILALNGAYIASNVPYEDIILVRDNTMDVIPFLCIEEYIEKITKIEDDMFKMLDISCLPVVIAGNKKSANQLKMIAQKAGNKDPFIIGDDTITDSVHSFNINMPYNPLDVYDLKTKYKNECMASLGIYSVEQKRERIVTQELVNQNDYTDFIYMNAYKERLLFVKLLNKASNLNVKLNETYEENAQASIDEKHDTALEIAKGKVEGIKEASPELIDNMKATAFMGGQTK